MSAPQPGTPLPWQIATGSAEYICGEGLWIASTMGVKGPDGEANAAYIVHACNNYPKAQALADALREAAIEVAAALAAAISLLERGGKAAKRAAPSDRMFDEMVADYKARLERARSIIAAWDAKP